MNKWIACLMLVWTAATAVAADDDPPRVVGRVYSVEGELSRYVPDENDWVDMVKDAPFTTGDTLFSGSRALVELIVPNGTWIRTGHETQIQYITLEAEMTEVDVSKGMVRFYTKSPGTTLKVTTRFGYVMADPDTTFDLYADADAVEVIAIKGNVRFIHQPSEARYEVSMESPSIIANQESVSSGEGTPDATWHRWNESRDSFWADRTRGRRRSIRYLPPSLHDESDVLDAYGQWERVPYEGSPRWFWRPTRVAVGWSPFTVGRWTAWCGDQTWIPAEPFGYITHHYGNWIYMRNAWFWAPPVVSVQADLPLLDIGYFWYPGRVSWIYRESYVGWVPLAPREIYGSHHHWGGPYVAVVGSAGFSAGFGMGIGSYAFVEHAIVVPRDRFYGVVNYRNIRVPHIQRATLVNKYRLSPVIDGSVIHHYHHIKERHFYGKKGFKGAPVPGPGIDRIRHNDRIIQKPHRMQPGHRGDNPKNIEIREKPVKRPDAHHGKDSKRAPKENRTPPIPPRNLKKNVEVRGNPHKGHGGHPKQEMKENRQGSEQWPKESHGHPGKGPKH